MIPEIREPGRAVTPEDVASLEKRFGCVLPEAYVRFLRETNGGRPKPRAFHGLRENDEAMVQHFLSVDGDEHTNLVENAAFFREYHDVPNSLLPIGRTTSGDLVCIGVAPGNRGQVWFWSHDHPVREEATWKLAEDFDAFLSTFHEVKL